MRLRDFPKLLHALSWREKEQALIDYLANKHAKAPKVSSKDPSQILIDDVIAKYVTDVVSGFDDPKPTLDRIAFLRKFWGGHTPDYVTGETCREYVKRRSTPAAARRELEDLRPAINHHRKEGLHDRLVSVWMPPKGKGKEVWFEREEAAAAIWHAYRYREIQKGHETDKRPRLHVARFHDLAAVDGLSAGRRDPGLA